MAAAAGRATHRRAPLALPPPQAPDAALIAHVGGMARVANSALSELLEPAVAAAMAPYEGVAVPESERIEQGAEELEALFRRVGGVPGLACGGWGPLGC